ncbi:protein PlpE, partial [Bisgaard Taxon 45]
MKKIVLKVSLLASLSSLLVACGSGGSSGGNSAHRVEENAQPIQLNRVSSIPSKNSLTDIDVNTSPHNKSSGPSRDYPEENKQQSPFQIPLAQEKNQVAQENFTWIGYRVSGSGSANNNVEKDKVTVFTFVKYDSPYSDDPVFDKTKTQSKTISLTDGGNNSKDDYYNFTLKDPLFYYGQYGEPSLDYKKVQENYIYAINPDAIDNENLNALTANYYKENGFIYSILSDV